MNTQATDRTYTPHADDDLKRLARRDRRAAMAGVVARYRARLLRHAGGIVRDPDVAADMVQDVFIKAMREPRLFEAEFRIGAWLHRVTGNLCLNLVRDGRRRADILADMPTRRVTDPDQIDALLQDERQARVQEAIGQLTPDHQRILRERFYADRSYQEIADALDLKLGTVMSRLSRAKDAICTALDQATADA